MESAFPVWVWISFFMLMITSLPTTNARKAEEDEWIRKHGTNLDTSGRWQALIDLQEDVPALQALCTQCHSMFFNNSRIRVTEAYVSDWLLTFPHNKNVEPIRATMAMYTTEERLTPDQPIPYFYFTKGTRPDCVIYVQETKMEFRFWRQICGIVMPTKLNNDDYERMYDQDEGPLVDDDFIAI